MDIINGLGITRALGGLFLLLLPGFLLSFLFFKSREITLLERLPLGFALGITLVTFALYLANKFCGLKINLLTSLLTIGIITIVIILALILKFGKSPPKEPVKPDEIRPKKEVWQSIALGLVLAFAFFMAFIPHLSYQYPLHIDEWFQVTRTQALLQAQSITFTDSFLGEKLSTTIPRLVSNFSSVRSSY
jgi:uncharacterized membrane protein YidH (DUF202 family)